MVWCDSFSCLKKNTLEPSLREKFNVVYVGLQEIYPDVKISNNIGYTKNISYCERRIRDIKGLLRQINIHSKQKVCLPPQEWENLHLFIELTLNNVPYCSRSLLTPEQ